MASWLHDFIHYSMHVLPLTFTFSIPENIVATIFSLFFWGHSLRRHWKRIAAFAVVEGLYADYSVFMLPFTHFLVVSLLASQILFLLFFRKLAGWWSALIMGCTMFAIGILGESGAAFIQSRVMVTADRLYHPLWLVAINAYWLAGLPLLILLMHKKHIHPGIQIMAYLRKQKGKSMLYLLFFLFLQILWVGLIESYEILYDPHSQMLPLTAALFAALILELAIIFATLRTIVHVRSEAIRDTQDFYLEDMAKLFTTIRGQRHDFINHVQVIQSLVRMGKTEQLAAYTRDLVGEIGETNDIIRVGDPALAALIQAKSFTALGKKIEFRHNCMQLSELDLGMKSIDIVKIVGNLVDNAMDEVSALPQNKRWVELEAWYDDSFLNLTTRNPGRILSAEEQIKIYEPGYSTKDNSRHSGVGLSVVKERVEHYKGAIQISSGEEFGTEFKISLPLKSVGQPKSSDPAVSDPPATLPLAPKS